MRVLFTGGGTGGHVYPALAIAKNILKKYPQSEVLYVGTKNGLEAKIVPETEIPFKTIEVEGWQRKFSWQLIKAGLKAIQGGTQALHIIRRFNPQLVIGTGGYVCGPVVLAAKILNIPTIIHEQNALPGLTNKTLARIVNKVMITFPDSIKYFSEPGKVVLTGLPIREEILKLSKEEGRKFFNLFPNKLTLLVSGGSRGAKSINSAMVEVYKSLYQRQDLQIIHITGEQGYKEMLLQLTNEGIDIAQCGNIILRPYLYEMEYALAAADLCVARAGATFLAEITARGLAGILIPYPYASENHQEFNARSLVEREAVVMILDKELTGANLTKAIVELLNDQERLHKMSKNAKKAGNPDSLEKIMKVLEEII